MSIETLRSLPLRCLRLDASTVVWKDMWRKFCASPLLDSLFLYTWFCLLSHACHASLNINCTHLGLQETACKYHIVKTLNTYINLDQNYSKYEPPVPSYDDLPIMVNVSMGLNHIPSVDVLAGTVEATTLLVLSWTDEMLKWNPDWTYGAYEVFIDHNWVWKPDFDLYNAVGLYEDQVQTVDLKLDYSGEAVWTLTTDLTFLCQFNLKNFPFDSQSCTAQFGSLRDDLYTTDFQFGPDDSLYTLSTLTSPSWKVNGVVISRVVDSDEYGSVPFLNWTIKLTRYSGYYVTAIILPMTLASFLSLITLWINDLSSRLSLSITAVLIIVALLWSLSFSQPVTEKLTWLQNFATNCTFFVVVVCVESTMAAYMTMKKGNPPVWVKYLIVFSTPRKICQVFKGVPATDAKEFEMSESQTISSIHASDLAASVSSELPSTQDSAESAAKANSDYYEGFDAPQWRYDPSSSQSLLNSDRSAAQPQSAKGSILEIESHRATWVRGARALDRLARTVMSLAFLLSFIIFIAIIPADVA